MSKPYFEIDDATLQAAKAKMESGDGQILVLRDNTARFWVSPEVIGYLSWTAVLHGWPERVQMDYGSDLRTGTYNFPVAGFRRITYTDPAGTLFHNATGGEYIVVVERPQNGLKFMHTGILLNVQLESGSEKVTLNGTYRCTSN